MGNTWDEASAALTAPGQPFELIDASVNGITMQVFKNAPPHLGYVFGAARQHGDKPFLVYEDERMSFTEAMQQVDALSCLLVNTYGIKKGDRVAVAMRNYPEWVMSFAAIISIGAVSVSMNSWWTADEMEFALEDSGSKVLICDDQRLALAYSFCQKQNIAMLLVRAEGNIPAGVGQWEKDLPLGSAHPGADISPDDDATILYTSGTTGRPKGAVSTHRAIISALMGFSLRVAVDNLREGTKPDPNALPTSFILIVPLFHVTGCIPVMMSCWVAGLKLVIMYKWDAEKALELISREKVTNFVGVPTQSWDLVNHPRFSDFDMSSMKAIGGGGAPAPAALVDKVAKSFKGGGPQLGYGMTETNAFGPGNRGADYISHPTSTGRTCLPMKLEVRDEQLRPLPVGERGETGLAGVTGVLEVDEVAHSEAHPQLLAPDLLVPHHVGVHAVVGAADQLAAVTDAKEVGIAPGAVHADARAAQGNPCVTRETVVQDPAGRPRGGAGAGGLGREIAGIEHLFGIRNQAEPHPRVSPRPRNRRGRPRSQAA